MFYIVSALLAHGNRMLVLNLQSNISVKSLSVSQIMLHHVKGPNLCFPLTYLIYLFFERLSF